MQDGRRLRFTAMWLAAFMLAAAKQSPAQAGPPADLDAFVTRSMKTFDVPGLAMAIVKDGKVLMAKGYGVRKMGESAPGRTQRRSRRRRWRHWWMREKFHGTTRCTNGCPDSRCTTRMFRTR